MPRPADEIESVVKREHPEARVDRRLPNGMEFVLPDGSRRLVLRGPVHLPDGTPIDTDLVAAPGLLAAGKAELGFGFRLQGNGGFWYSPEPGVEVEVGGPEYLSPTGWRNLPLTHRSVTGNRAEWDSPQGRFVIVVKANGMVISELTVDSVAANTGWRMSLAGSLTPNEGQWRGDSDRQTGRLVTTVGGGFVTYDPVPDGAIYPVTVRV